ncbi:hypothetical protein [Pseudoalteromonas piscicida]|uniref:hypothetical protein n=1 Tax=Pseudoalteromonas piscicida TaxID=43662 RepID=UPI0005FA7CF2|nr:hypothetical protein [Pseudoalteromonas piscicida]KJZ03290.1 hypothetical protein TW73_09090 [Pseudoalteromonas piscicida]
MPTPVTVYRWDDEGAPQITERYGSAIEIKTILEACLVTGYGSKQALGWSKVFDDTNGVVFQNNTNSGGSGGMVKFWPKTGGWEGSFGSAGGMHFQAAKSFINSETAHHPGFFQTFYHPVTSSEVKAWVLIGTAKAFYLILSWLDESKSSSNYKYMMTSYHNYQGELFVGDFESELDSDAGKFIAFHSPTKSDETSIGWYTTLGYLHTSLSAGASETGVKVYNADNSDAHVIYNPRVTFSKGSVHVTSEGANVFGVAPVPLMSNGSQNFPPVIDTTKPTLRGYMPGLVNVMLGLNRLSHWPQETLIDGQKYFQLHSADATCSHFWINMEQW